MGLAKVQTSTNALLYTCDLPHRFPFFRRGWISLNGSRNQKTQRTNQSLVTLSYTFCWGSRRKVKGGQGGETLED